MYFSQLQTVTKENLTLTVTTNHRQVVNVVNKRSGLER